MKLVWMIALFVCGSSSLSYLALMMYQYYLYRHNGFGYKSPKKVAKIKLIMAVIMLISVIVSVILELILHTRSILSICKIIFVVCVLFYAWRDYQYCSY